MKRKAQATWQGSAQKGRGQLSTESGVLNQTPYSFAARFGSEKGTNPEELIGAAHAGCFAMALSGALGAQNIEPLRLDVSAEVSIEKEGEGFRITSSILKLTADVPGVDENTFKRIAEEAKKNCPVSKVLNADISLETTLASSSTSEARM